MRYYRKSLNSLADIDRIAGEAINITFGRNYFVEGKINETPDMKTNYNTYMIDSVEYEIHPNIGVIIIICADSLKDSLDASIRQRIVDFERQLYAKFGFKRPAVGGPGTTQYLTIEDETVTTTNTIGFYSRGARLENVPAGSLFAWCVDTSLEQLVLGGSVDGRYDREKMVMSLSAIMYDESGAFSLPDGHRSPDYPKPSDTVNYQNGKIITTPIFLSMCHGLIHEVARAFGTERPVVKEAVSATRRRFHNQDSLLHTMFPVDRPLNWLKWDDVQPINADFSMFDFAEQINRGLLNFDSTLCDESDVKQTGKKFNADYRCFVTNMPLYEDTYVFDVFQQVIEEVIDSRDLANFPGAEVIPMLVKPAKVDVVVGTGDGAGHGTGTGNDEAEVVEDEEDDVPEDDEEDGDQYISRYERRREKAKKKKALLAKKKASDEKKRLAAEQKALAKAKKDAEKAMKDVEKNKDVVETTAETTSVVSTSVKKKMPVKRGQKQAIEFVRVRRVINYDTPRHLLISPYYIHCYGLMDAIKDFEAKTKTKVLVYRTFVPRTLYEIIESLDIQPSRKIALHEINKCVKVKGRNLKAGNVTLYDYLDTNDMVKPISGTSIMGTWVAK
jgi:hypothetical protein